MATRRRGAPRMNLNVPANWSSDRQAAAHFLAAARAEFGDTAATMETAEAVARAHGINVSDRGGTRAYTDRVIAALRSNRDVGLGEAALGLGLGYLVYKQGESAAARREKSRVAAEAELVAFDAQHTQRKAAPTPRTRRNSTQITPEMDAEWYAYALEGDYMHYAGEPVYTIRTPEHTMRVVVTDRGSFNDRGSNFGISVAVWFAGHGWVDCSFVYMPQPGRYESTWWANTGYGPGYGWDQFPIDFAVTVGENHEVTFSLPRGAVLTGPDKVPDYRQLSHRPESPADMTHDNAVAYVRAVHAAGLPVAAVSPPAVVKAKGGPKNRFKGLDFSDTDTTPARKPAVSRRFKNLEIDRENASRPSSRARAALLHVGVPVTQVDQLSARSNGRRKPAKKPAKPRKPKLQLYDPSQPLPYEVAPELPRPRKSRPNNVTSAAPGDRLTFYTQLVEDIIGKLVSMTPTAQHEAARALIHHLLLLEGVRDHNEAYRVSQLVREELIAEGHLSRSNGARVTAVEVQAQIRRAILLQVRAGERARVDALLQALTDLCADKPPEVVVRRLIAADVWS